MSKLLPQTSTMHQLMVWWEILLSCHKLTHQLSLVHSLLLQLMLRTFFQAPSDCTYCSSSFANLPIDDQSSSGQCRGRLSLSLRLSLLSHDRKTPISGNLSWFLTKARSSKQRFVLTSENETIYFLFLCVAEVSPDTVAFPGHSEKSRAYMQVIWMGHGVGLRGDPWGCPPMSTRVFSIVFDNVPWYVGKTQMLFTGSVW